MDKIKKKAEGLGTLIIFIAMVLVAATTVTVLYDVTGRRQASAKNKADASRKEVITK